MAIATRGELRTQGRRARRAVCGVERELAEAAIASHVAGVWLPAGSTVGTFVADDGEPDLERVASALRSAGHRMALPVPAEAADDFTMCFREWTVDDVLRPGRYGIPCPANGGEVQPDVVLVPLVRFDPSGARLGRGAGFYDRWLGTQGSAATTIGVAFERQRAERLPCEPHDVPLDIVVTELGIRFGRPMERE